MLSGGADEGQIQLAVGYVVGRRCSGSTCVARVNIIIHHCCVDRIVSAPTGVISFCHLIVIILIDN